MPDQPIILSDNLNRLAPKRDWMIPMLASLGTALLSLLLSGYSAYNHNDKDITSRVLVLESQRKDDKDRLERIENKVDRVLDAVRSKQP